MLRLNWRTATIAALLFVVFEGALRKWFLPEIQEYIYFAKDGLLLIAYLGYAFDTRTPPVIGPARTILGLTAIAAVYGFAEFMNPGTTLPLALLGWRAYFLYVPLIVVVPALFRNADDLMRSVRKYIALTIPLAILALLQFQSGASSRLNAYAWGSGDVAVFGEDSTARTTATFSYMSGYVSFLLVATLCGVGLLAARAWRVKGSVLVLVCLVASLAGVFTTGSRAPIYTLIVVAPVLYILLALAGAAPPFRAGVLFVAILALVAYSVPEPIAGLQYRAANSDDPWERIMAPVNAPLEIMDASGFVGFGIGATQNAASYLGSTNRVAGGIAVEVETARVLLELGFIGFALIFGIRAYLTIQAFRLVFRFRSTPLRGIAAALACYLLTQYVGLVVNVTADIYYWFAAGLLFALRRFDSAPVVRQSPAPSRDGLAATPPLAYR